MVTLKKRIGKAKRKKQLPKQPAHQEPPAHFLLGIRFIGRYDSGSDLKGELSGQFRAIEPICGLAGVQELPVELFVSPRGRPRMRFAVVHLGHRFHCIDHPVVLGPETPLLLLVLCPELL